MDILRAEHLPPMDVFKVGVDAYIKASLGINSIKTSIAKHGPNPIWNERVELATLLPNN